MTPPPLPPAGVLPVPCGSPGCPLLLTPHSRCPAGSLGRQRSALPRAPAPPRRHREASDSPPTMGSTHPHGLGDSPHTGGVVSLLVSPPSPNSPLPRAHSVTWNPHKMLAAGLQCSAFLLRDTSVGPTTPSPPHAIPPPHHRGGVNPSVRPPPHSRVSSSAATGPAPRTSSNPTSSTTSPTTPATRPPSAAAASTASSCGCSGRPWAPRGWPVVSNGPSPPLGEPPGPHPCPLDSPSVCHGHPLGRSKSYTLLPHQVLGGRDEEEGGIRAGDGGKASPGRCHHGPPPWGRVFVLPPLNTRSEEQNNPPQGLNPQKGAAD